MVQWEAIFSSGVCPVTISSLGISCTLEGAVVWRLRTSSVKLLPVKKILSVKNWLKVRVRSRVMPRSSFHNYTDKVPLFTHKGFYRQGLTYVVDPGGRLVSSEGWGEGAEVCDGAGRDQHVASQVVVGDAERVGGVVPTILLASQSADQLLGSIQLLLAQIHLLLQCHLYQRHHCNVIFTWQSGETSF